MGATQTWILRSSVVLGMVAAVFTVLYFTPMPEHHFESCDRPCHELDWPMICRIKLTIEEFYTLSRSCLDCPKNFTHCKNKDCIYGDGSRRSLYTANRQFPGPAIQVCKNDILVVDVSNRIPGQEFSIHWRGQTQEATPVMDGVPMITQCPVTSFTTLQYKFRATTPGTHIWQAYSNSHAAEGLFGALIVRQPDVVEPQKRLYDVDNKDYTVLITEWERKEHHKNAKNVEFSYAFSLLLNGKSGKLLEFPVKRGLRYRFRIAYATGKRGCPVEVSIDKHTLKVITLDGHPVNPYEVSSLIMGKGERIDFILKANQPSGAYKFNVVSQCKTSTTASLIYEDEIISKTPEENETIKPNARVFQTDVCQSELGKVCLGDVQSLFVMPSALRSEKVDTQLHLAFDHFMSSVNDLGKSVWHISHMNNVTFTFPSSPLLTQLYDVNVGQLCNRRQKPEVCADQELCQCVHVEEIPLGNSVEIILIDNGGEKENVFHLHGYSFYVVASRLFSEPVSVEAIEDLDNQGLLFKRNLISPAKKDTIRIPRYGVVAVRFVANNAGYWLLRDELASHWSRGMDVVLQVGSLSDQPSPPSYFPKCGNWIGPDFFLV